MTPVIICGGAGTKLWPESRQSFPKQFLPLFNGKSLFQLNWEALRVKFSAKAIYIQTSKEQAKIARSQVREIITQNIFIEPEMRNTGPATGFTTAQLYKKDPDEPFFIIQSDVLRTPTPKLLHMIEACDTLAKETGKYITGGIKPAYPVMGVDYLLPGKRVTKKGKVTAFEVDKFLWRTTLEKTKQQIKKGALIHANHTCMTPRGFLEMYKKYRVEWHQPLMRIINGAHIQKEYAKMPIGPLEEITQQAHKNGETLIVKLPFAWTDFGTWDSLVNHTPLSNFKTAHIEEIESTGNFMRVKNNKQVALIGVEDLIIIDTEDALLICPKGQSSKVSEIVQRLKKQGKNKLL